MIRIYLLLPLTNLVHTEAMSTSNVLLYAPSSIPSPVIFRIKHEHLNLYNCLILHSLATSTMFSFCGCSMPCLVVKLLDTSFRTLRTQHGLPDHYTHQICGTKAGASTSSQSVIHSWRQITLSCSALSDDSQDL